MPQYTLLLHESTTEFADLSPDEMQRIITKYQDWSRKVAEAGRLVGGHKLRDGSGRVMTGANGKPVVRDGPYIEGKEVIGGYFIITADHYDHAVKIASDCPHLAYGGTIEVREIEKVD